MVQTILGLALEIAKIVDKTTPGFYEKFSLKVFNLKKEFADEIGKSVFDIDAAKLDSIEYELRNIQQLLHSAVQSANDSTKSQ